MRASALVALLLCGCPTTTRPPVADAAVDDAFGAFCNPVPSSPENLASCSPLATDYQPRGVDSWPSCISDDNLYTPIDAVNVSTPVVAAFETIADSLWRHGVRAGPQAFVDARALYVSAIAPQVQALEDVHFDAGVMPCTSPSGAADNAERCLGAARMAPSLEFAFSEGAQAASPRSQAAQIEAALLWFFYVSALQQVELCTRDAKACDASWAAYSGGTGREQPLGLGQRVRALGVGTHDRIYDATLAVRCWRNLDHENGEAMDLTRRDLARAQLDRALIRGVALIIRQVLTELGCSTGEVRDAHMTFLNTLAPWFDHAVRERDPARADVLKVELNRPWAWELNVPAAVAALDAVFPCP